MPTTTNFRFSDGSDFGNSLITKEYLMSVYPQIANQLITPELWVWGKNSYGQLGNNTTTIRSTPVTTFSGGANWKQIDCGGYYTAGIKTDGTLWAWGDNTRGQIGDNTSTNRSIPVTTFSGGTNWKQVSCGGYFTVAIKTDGTLWTWGRGTNNRGNLGDNTSGTDKLTPVTTFAGGTDWASVSCGPYFAVAIKTNGTLWTWGDNGNGQLGINNTAGFAHRSTPVTTFAGGTNWKQASCTYRSVVAVKTDGTLWTWGGAGGGGELGDNTTITRSTPVTTFAGGTNWKQVGSTGSAVFGIKTDGTLWAWGNNNNGTLGNNSGGTTILTPVTTFAGGTNWKYVSGSSNGETSSAIKTDGTLWIWGYNQFDGRLGINLDQPQARSTPVTTFAGGTDWKQVSSAYHSAAIKTSDDLQGI